jgi:uncharacterized protein (TIGR02678 family)
VSAERLAEALTQHRVEERERALRALLMRPLMTASDPDFSAVRGHAEFLRGWLARETGWALLIERDCARLRKLPADRLDATRGAAGFNRRRYVLFCLACAVLERAEPQITLRMLGERLLDFAAEPELAARGFSFTLEVMHERHELVHVCRYLLTLGVLHRVAGDEDAYVRHGGDALYDVHRRLLAGLLACTRGPSTFPEGSSPASLTERVAALTDEYVPESEEAQRTAIRHRLARRLLDDPVVYFDELPAEERDYATNQRGVMAARLCAASGLKPELRAEGMALVDADGELTDCALPAEGTLAHATLLVAEFLANAARSDPGRSVPGHEIAAFLRSAAERYGRYWRKAARDPGAENELCDAALAQLVALKLVGRCEEGWSALPALARFAVRDAEVRTAVQIDMNLV